MAATVVRGPADTIISDMDKVHLRDVGTNRPTYEYLNLSMDSVMMQGALGKRFPSSSFPVKLWHSRVVVIKDNFLYLFCDKKPVTRQRLCEVAYIKGAVIERVSLFGRAHAVAITPVRALKCGREKPPGWTLYLGARSHDEMEQWYNALRQAAELTTAERQIVETADDNDEGDDDDMS